MEFSVKKFKNGKTDSVENSLDLQTSLLEKRPVDSVYRKWKHRTILLRFSLIFTNVANLGVVPPNE
jgi:hypothetical protein